MIPLQIFTIYDNNYAGFFTDEDYDVGQIVTKLDDEKYEVK